MSAYYDTRYIYAKKSKHFLVIPRSNIVKYSSFSIEIHNFRANIKNKEGLFVRLKSTCKKNLATAHYELLLIEK